MNIVHSSSNRQSDMAEVLATGANVDNCSSSCRDNNPREDVGVFPYVDLFGVILPLSFLIDCFILFWCYFLNMHLPLSCQSYISLKFLGFRFRLDLRQDLFSTLGWPSTVRGLSGWPGTNVLTCPPARWNSCWPTPSRSKSLHNGWGPNG